MRFLLPLLMAGLLMAAEPSPQATSARFFQRAAGLAGSLRSVRLNPNLNEAVAQLTARLADDGFAVKPHEPRGEMQVGGKLIPIANANWWKRLEAPSARAWGDIVELPDEAAASRIPEQWRQPHTGTTYENAFVFIALMAESGRDSVGAVAVRGRHVINLGTGLPFRVRLWESPGNSADELMQIGRAADQLARILEATVTALKDPAYITWIPPAEPTAEQIRMRRAASFARLWSEAKYNFVFLKERKNLDWENVLELYLPRILAAQSDAEYVETMQEALALLEDGHTSVWGGNATDQPPLRIEPVEGRPVVTGIANVPELRATAIRVGMEVVSVDGVPVDEPRKKHERIAAASTAQSKAGIVALLLLRGTPDSVAKLVFRDRAGGNVATELKRNQMSVAAEALPWRKPVFEYRELPGNIAYIALNSFGTEQVVKKFDEHFERILKASGLIIDVRENGGGSSGNGYDIVSRLIDKGAKVKTTAWRTRSYKPALRAWGQPEEWHEGTHEEIEARGETPYPGPVMVLIGSKTFSAAEDFLAPLKIAKRAKFVGTPTGGSTGQPLIVPLYQASARICTKWDRFADGTEFVGIGVQPDVRVEQTIADVAAGRDPVLEKAQELLRESGK